MKMSEVPQRLPVGHFVTGKDFGRYENFARYYTMLRATRVDVPKYLIIFI